MKRLLPLLLLAMAAVFFLFNSQLLSGLFEQGDDITHIDVKTTIPEKTLASDSLYHWYKTDHQQAKSMYHQKVIAIDGIITSIQRNSFGNYEITLGEGVVTKFNQKSARQIENLNIGDSLLAKGLCSGLMSTGSEKVVLILCERM